MLVFGKKKTGGNKTEQLHIMHICLRNEVTTGGAVNVLSELPNVAEIHIAVFFIKTNFFMGYLLAKHPVQG